MFFNSKQKKYVLVLIHKKNLITSYSKPPKLK